MSWLASREGGAQRAGIKAVLPENGVVADLTADKLAQLLGATRMTASGIEVTPEIAMRVSAVYGCVALIAGAISTLPLPVYERVDEPDGSESRRQARHDYWWMLNEQAYQQSSDAAAIHPGTFSSAVAFEYFVASRLFYGDAFALIQRPNNFTNKVTGWIPLHPYRCQPFFDSQNFLRYRVTDRLGHVRVYDPSDILHVPSMGFDGLRSPSPITYAAREAIGMSLAAEEFSARFFSQGSTHDIALTTDKKLNEPQIDLLRQTYVAKYGGGKNSRVPLILSGGLKVEKLSITPQDAALIASRQFTVEEICRVIGVPPFMVGMTDKTTSWGSGVDSMGINFVKYTLRRHLTPIEQEFNRKLWPNRERFFVEYDTAALERGDFKTRNEGYRAALGGAGMPGYMTPDEVRHRENLPPIAGGDKLFTGESNAPDPTPPAAG
jgi:HK97 family phage portal protein